MKINPVVLDALKNNKPVVALETTIISHGMPYPKNVETALKVEQVIREHGAIPATIGIINGEPMLPPCQPLWRTSPRWSSLSGPCVTTILLAIPIAWRLDILRILPWILLLCRWIPFRQAAISAS